MGARAAATEGRMDRRRSIAIFGAVTALILGASLAWRSGTRSTPADPAVEPPRAVAPAAPRPEVKAPTVAAKPAPDAGPAASLAAATSTARAAEKSSDRPEAAAKAPSVTAE